MSASPVLEPLTRRLRALPPAGVDAALAVGVAVAGLWPFFSRTNPAGGPWHAWGVVVVLATAGCLWWRRRFPVAVLLGGLLGAWAYDFARNVPAQPVWYGVLIALYTVAVRSGPWPRVAALAITVGGSLLTASSETALRSGILFVAAYAIGRAAVTSRAHAEALRERAEWLDRERLAEAARAAERERARIARDMHDILSHAVSLMVVQAEAGPVALPGEPARAEAAFDAIASSGRDAMAQLRRMLTVLKTDDGPHDPQPSLDDLPRLVEGASGAGTDIAFAVSGVPGELTPDAEVAAYRITQEALTNIVKHAEARHAGVRLDWQDGTLTLEITDDGRGPAGDGTGGHGLIGIRERATACGGEVTAGPRADGPGFRVRVRFGVRA
ncbi:sensor histidine kinase [Amycolatopsis sp. lyj-346]|uniref:sensor histidine kinase n=1 Tax=Amycolatopsis sp. lyj-346 TaxID=2789289 RepID=UPI00397A5D42